MKAFLKGSVFAIATFLSVAGFNARADLEVSASIQVHAVADFDGPLAPMGTWVTVGSYGRCWHPNAVAVDWRPYSVGQWEWTDAGWYWVSDEPFGWACYHYGNWFYDSSAGWVWVPGVQWAPAWVSWRTSDAHIGWAPLPPRGIVVAPELFAFVDVGHFHDHLSPGRLTVKNEAVIRETKVMGDRRGPDTAVVRKAVGNLKPVPVREIDQRTQYPKQLARNRSELHPEKVIRPQPAKPDVERRAPAPREPEHSIQPREPQHESPPVAPAPRGDEKHP